MPSISRTSCFLPILSLRWVLMGAFSGVRTIPHVWAISCVLGSRRFWLKWGSPSFGWALGSYMNAGSRPKMRVWLRVDPVRVGGLFRQLLFKCLRVHNISYVVHASSVGLMHLYGICEGGWHCAWGSLQCIQAFFLVLIMRQGCLYVLVVVHEGSQSFLVEVPCVMQFTWFMSGNVPALTSS